MRAWLWLRAGPAGAGAVSPYPQPRALGAALLEAQLGLVGRILAAVAPINQAAILDALLAVAQCGTGPPGPQRRKDRVEPARRQAAVMAAAAAALAGAAALVAGGRAALAAAGELAPRVRQLADEVLEESAGSVALQRAASDLYAFAAQLCSDAGATQLLRALCTDMAQTASLPRRAALALAVGSCARAVGVLSLQAVLPVATETLVAVAVATDKSIRCGSVLCCPNRPRKCVEPTCAASSKMRCVSRMDTHTGAGLLFFCRRRHTDVRGPTLVELLPMQRVADACHAAGGQCCWPGICAASQAPSGTGAGHASVRWGECKVGHATVGFWQKQ